MNVKKIAFLLSLLFCGSSNSAPPTGNDFPKEMPLHEYLAQSIADDADRKKMALSYYSNFGKKDSFSNLLAYKAKNAIREHSVDFFVNMFNPMVPYTSATAANHRREQSEKLLDALAYKLPDVEKNIGASAPFDNWFSCYVSWFFVAASEGGRVLKTWPNGTEPLVGTVIYANKEAGENLLKFIPDLNSEFGVKIKAQWEKEQKNGAAIGINISAFDHLVRRFNNVVTAVAKTPGLNDDQYHAYQFMKSVTLAIYYSQALSGVFIPKNEITSFAENSLGAYKDQHEATMASGWSAKSILIPVEKNENRTDYARGYFESLSATEQNIDQIKRLEENISRWYFLPLSKKGEPVKFAYRPITGFKKMMAWTMVEFTEKGIQTRSLGPAEERKMTQKFRWQWSPNESPYGHPSCQGWEISNNPCLQYRFGNFGHGRTLGVLRDVRFIDNASFGIPDLPVD